MSLFFYRISALISLSLPMTIRVSPSVNTCSGPGMGEQVPSMADGQDIDIVAGPHLALQDAVAGPAVRQLDHHRSRIPASAPHNQRSPGCSVADSQPLRHLPLRVDHMIGPIP